MTTLKKDFLEDLNTVLLTLFKKSYETFNSELSVLSKTIKVGNVASTTIPFSSISNRITLFTGSRKHTDPSKNWKISIENKPYDGAIDIPKRDYLRAQTENKTTGLDLYGQDIKALGEEAKDKPIEQSIDMLLNGDTDKFGLCMDKQTLFSTTHDYNDKAGTQSNLLAGTGISLSQLATDLKTAMTEMKGFYFNQRDDKDVIGQRNLNNKTSFTVICSPKLYFMFKDLVEMKIIDGVGSNNLANSFEVVSQRMKNTNDWYLIETSDTNTRPIITCIEDTPKMDSPIVNDYQLREHKVLSWGVEMSFGCGYGAWWKAIKVANA